MLTYCSVYHNKQKIVCTVKFLHFGDSYSKVLMMDIVVILTMNLGGPDSYCFRYV